VTGSILWLTLFLAGSGSGIEALGIVASPTAEHSVAILISGGVTRIVGPGDEAFGGIVSSIEPGRVLLALGGEVQEVRLRGAVAPTPQPAIIAARVEEPEEADPPEPFEVTLPKAEVDRRLLAEMPRILATTRLIPVQRNGEVVGFSLEQLPEGTLLGEVGLQDGDVLTHINRVALDSMATLVGLWPRLQGATELTAQVIRSGQPLSLSVSIR
jgi:type II secretion system protein C